MVQAALRIIHSFTRSESTVARGKSCGNFGEKWLRHVAEMEAKELGITLIAFSRQAGHQHRFYLDPHRRAQERAAAVFHLLADRENFIDLRSRPLDGLGNCYQRAARADQIIDDQNAVAGPNAIEKNLGLSFLDILVGESDLHLARRSGRRPARESPG